MTHYHYLTLEQRGAVERILRARAATPEQLRLALERLHAPDYGVCIECRADIGYVRLEDDPDALHCQACARLPTVFQPERPVSG
jgi:RNA polymerase-binding transcription factor DksA